MKQKVNNSKLQRLILTILCSITYTLSLFGQDTNKLIMQANRMSSRGNFASALITANKIIESKEKTSPMSHSDSIYVMQAYAIKAKCYYGMGNMTEALKIFTLTEKYAQEIGNKSKLADIYNAIFAIYYHERNFTNAEDLLNKALKICISIKDSARIISLYNNKALIEYEKGNYNAAIDRMNKAMSFTSGKDKIAQSLVLTNKAEVYFMTNKLAEAEQTLEKAMALQQKKITERTIQTVLNAALVKAHMKKTNETVTLVGIIKKNMGRLPLAIKENTYKELTEIYFVMGDSLNGFRNMKAGIEISDSLQAIDNKTELQHLLVAYDSERLKKDNELLQQEVRIRSLITVAAIIVFLVITCFSIAIVRRMKSDKEKNKLIAKQRERLLALEKKEHERNKMEMSRKLDHKNRQLTSFTIDMSAINAFHKKIGKALEEIEKTLKDNNNVPQHGEEPTKEEVSTAITTQKSYASENARKKIKEIINELSRYDERSTGEDFRIYFEEVHPGYLKKLSHAYPHLSDTDLRMCAYLFLGMSTKEIASLTFREVRSVESSRNRLRKKLNLPVEANLKDFLSSEEWGFNNLQ